MLHVCAKPVQQEVGQPFKVLRAAFAFDSLAAASRDFLLCGVARASGWLWVATWDMGGQATGSCTDSPCCIQQGMGTGRLHGWERKAVSGCTSMASDLNREGGDLVEETWLQGQHHTHVCSG